MSNITIWVNEDGEAFLQVTLDAKGVAFSVPLEVADLRLLLEEAEDALQALDEAR